MKPENRLTHSQMVQTRRRKQAGKKQLARIARQAKKAGMPDTPGVGAASAVESAASSPNPG
ncbi:MAG: hypothetical protein ACXWUS_14710 [Burkholderiales bacterium]